jgi:hypothetical protein
MHPQNEIGRAPWTRPVFEDQDGAPGTAQHVSKRHHHSDATYYVRAYRSLVKAAGVALPTGVDAHDPIHSAH